jgi:hypothetical protein
MYTVFEVVASIFLTSSNFCFHFLLLDELFSSLPLFCQFALNLHDWGCLNICRLFRVILV